MDKDRDDGVRARWARLRFSIIGPLLASPPEHGELGAELERLSKKQYLHPTTGEVLRFGKSTLERWLYLARSDPQDPIGALVRQVHSHAGTHPSMGPVLREAARAQYRQHPRWSYQLHYDNLLALAKTDATLESVPSVGSLARFMKANGMVKRRRRKRLRDKDGNEFEQRETRSYEVEHVYGLWHSDFHECSRSVLTPSGERPKPQLFAVMDDRSRLCCHAQWYWAEDSQSFVHGLTQAFLKRGLPRELLTDNGTALLAAECAEGLERLSIIHNTTLPRHPQQNGKQEAFWGPMEGRLMAMLEGEQALTLDKLNAATQAWVELEYNRHCHSELGQSPLDAFLEGKSVGRDAPDAEALRHLFRRQATRTQRRSDGTVTVEGVRFEIPSRYRTLLRPTLRYAKWDLSSVDLVDPQSGRVLCALYPLDKLQNANRHRRTVDPLVRDELDEPPSEMAPLLKQLMAEYAATGLPPAYLPGPDKKRRNEEVSE